MRVSLPPRRPPERHFVAARVDEHAAERTRLVPAICAPAASMTRARTTMRRSGNPAGTECPALLLRHA